VIERVSIHVVIQREFSTFNSVAQGGKAKSKRINCVTTYPLVQRPPSAGLFRRLRTHHSSDGEQNYALTLAPAIFAAQFAASKLRRFQPKL
jgi:hypothetical protein